MGQPYMMVLEELLGSYRVAVAHSGTKTLRAENLGSTHWCELSWRLPFWQQDLAPTNSL